MADQKLQGKKIAFIATDMVEQVELTEPWQAVEEAGGQPELVSIETGEIQAFNHLDKAETYKVDKDCLDGTGRRLRRSRHPGRRRQPRHDALRRRRGRVRALVLRGGQARRA